MESITDLLSSTESLLAKAESNIETLQSMKFEQDLTEKLQPFIEKYAKVSEAIKKRKEKLLGILVRLAWLSGARTYDTYVGGYKYGIKSPTRIEVYTVPAMSRSYTVAEFVDNRALKYNDFCEWIIRQLAEFLRYIPHQHTNELEAIKKFIGELTELTERYRLLAAT